MIIMRLILHCASNNKHRSPGASSRSGEALPRGTGTQWGQGEPCCWESVGLPTQGHAGDASGISIGGTEERSSPCPPLQPLQVPATWKISSNFIQAPFPLSLPAYSLAKVSTAICSFLQAFHYQQPKETSWLNPAGGGFGACSWHSPGCFCCGYQIQPGSLRKQHPLHWEAAQHP